MTEEERLRTTLYLCTSVKAQTYNAGRGVTLGFGPVSVPLRVQDIAVQQKQLLLSADFNVFCYETWRRYEVTGCVWGGGG